MYRYRIKEITGCEEARMPALCRDRRDEIMMISTWRFLLVVTGLASALSACAGAPVEKSQLIAINNSRHAIHAIKYRLCSDQPSPYFEIPNTDIRAGESVSVRIQDPCIDVIAVGEDGRVLGRQSRLRIPPKVRWSIR